MNFNGLFFILSLGVLQPFAGAAAQYKVGGSMGWTSPADPNPMSYNQWAESNRFQIGDSLLFVYHPDQDSVLQVDENAYNNCSTSSYISKFDDGNTVFTFNRSGPFYFISGVEKNCKKKESMTVVVMADRSKTSSPSSSSSASSKSPSPPSPSAPPMALISPPPTTLPNGASMVFAGFMELVGGSVGLGLFVLSGV